MEIKEFVKARNEMLMKADVNALREFVNSREEYSKEYKAWFNANANLHEWTLHKMIVATVGLPKEVKEKSLKWLEEN